MFHRNEESLYSYSATKDACRTTAEMRSDFGHNGYIVVKDVFSSVEIKKLLGAIESSQEFRAAQFSLGDLSGKKFQQAQWSEVGSDAIGMACRTEKVAGIAEELLAKGPLYLYSGKVIMKPAHEGGSLIWHQDYGYWYNNGCLFPDFVMAFVALTKNDRENGGLQILKGSHRCGRLEHVKQAGQTGAELERVAKLEERLDLVHCDLGPGDLIFFHANILHRSLANDSPHRRWNLIFSYNSVHNRPAFQGKNYNNDLSEASKVHKVSQDAVLGCEAVGMEPRTYLDPKDNHNIRLET